MTLNHLRILDNGRCFKDETSKCFLNKKGSFEFHGKRNQILQGF